MAVTDIHTHLIPRAGGRPVGPDELYHAPALRGWLATAGIDRALVSVPPPLYRQHLDEDSSRRWVRGVNDGLREMTSDGAGLVPLGYLPLEHPDVALAELDRLAASGWRGFTAAAGGRSVSLADPALAPLWEKLAAQERPLVLHPAASPDPRLGTLYLQNLLGNPQESGLAAAQLLLGGVLHTHPGLRVALVHCGGVLPAVLGRWQRGVDTARPGLHHRPASDLRREARQLWVDCLAHDRDVVDLALRIVGPDRMLIGSDWPFPMGAEHPLGLVAHCGERIANRIAVANAARFLGW